MPHSENEDSGSEPEEISAEDRQILREYLPYLQARCCQCQRTGLPLYSKCKIMCKRCAMKDMYKNMGLSSVKTRLKLLNKKAEVKARRDAREKKIQAQLSRLGAQRNEACNEDDE